MRLRAPDLGVEAELRPGMVLGRLSSVDLCLPDSSVSRRHARVEEREDGWWLVDLGSSNGLRLRGRRVEACPLRPGTRLHLGAVLLEVEGPPEGSPPLREVSEPASGPRPAHRQEAPAAEEDPGARRAAAIAEERRAFLREARRPQRSAWLGDLGQQPFSIQLLVLVAGLAFLTGVALLVRWLAHALAAT